MFNHVFGPVAAAVPLTVFGWVGRILSWAVLAWLLVRLGSRIGLPPMAAAAAIVLWLVANQALIGGDWMFGTFEAKTVADLLVVGALLAATRERWGRRRDARVGGLGAPGPRRLGRVRRRGRAAGEPFHA